MAQGFLGLRLLIWPGRLGSDVWLLTIEHKHFESFGQSVYDNPKTVISKEFSTEYRPGMEPYYPVNDERNNQLAEQYRQLAAAEQDVIFGGRLAEYKYYDMAPVIAKAFEAWKNR